MLIKDVTLTADDTQLQLWICVCEDVKVITEDEKFIFVQIIRKTGIGFGKGVTCF